MTFNDNSDFAPMVTIASERGGKGKGRGAEIEEVARGEEFVLAQVSFTFVWSLR